MFVLLLLVESSSAAEKWPGIDDAVVNKIAREHGRSEKPSLIPAAEGDLQLFLFLLAGAVGGFGAGYYWRVLTEGKNKPADDKLQG
jgi:ABC-type cobalt transport system substrate-binding protein